MPRVSVVTTAHNAESFVEAAIRSIQAQTMRDWEHLVVDDGSTDATSAIVERAAKSDKRIRLLSNPKALGAYRAANEAIATSSGALIARLDADDVSHPRRLEVQTEALDREPGRVASTGGWWAMDESGHRQGSVRPVPSRSNQVLKWRLFLRSGLVHSTLVIRRSAFEELGGYGEGSVAEDFRLWGKLVRGNGLAIVDDPLVGWRRHARQTVADPGTRFEHARLEVRAEHMTASTGSSWSEEDARLMRMLGERSPQSLDGAAALMGRWRASWVADSLLLRSERRELGRFSVRVALGHLKRNPSRRLTAYVPWMRILVGAGRTAL